MKIVLHYPKFFEMVGGIVMDTCLCWSLRGDPWSPLWPPKDAPLFSPASRSLRPEPSLSDTPGPLLGQRNIYNSAHAAEQRIQGTHRPSLLKSALNPHLLCCVAISHKHTWEKPPEPLNLTWQGGLFLHRSPCCSAERAKAMPLFHTFCTAKSHLFSGTPALTLSLLPFIACLDSEGSFKASGSDTPNVSMPFGYSPHHPWAIPFPEAANAQDLAATRKGLSTAGTLKNPIC